MNNYTIDHPLYFIGKDIVELTKLLKGRAYRGHKPYQMFDNTCIGVVIYITLIVNNTKIDFEIPDCLYILYTSSGKIATFSYYRPTEEIEERFRQLNLPIMKQDLKWKNT